MAFHFDNPSFSGVPADFTASISTLTFPSRITGTFLFSSTRTTAKTLSAASPEKLKRPLTTAVVSAFRVVTLYNKTFLIPSGALPLTVYCCAPATRVIAPKSRVIILFFILMNVFNLPILKWVQIYATRSILPKETVRLWLRNNKRVTNGLFIPYWV